MDWKEMEKSLEYMRQDSAHKNRKGIAFIGASIVIWLVILIIHLQDISIEMKNLYTWFTTALLMPVACGIMKGLGIKLNNKENPLNGLGMLFTMNQMLYLTIVCWVFAAVPEKMVMVFAMVFGGHLLPFGWLYKSKSYTISAIVITVSALMIGCNAPAWVLALCMFVYEIIFTICLEVEYRLKVLNR